MVGAHAPTGTLSAVRSVLDDAEEAILCSAFVRRGGVHLIERQLKGLGSRGRLVATTVFGGSSSMDALNATLDLGLGVRVVNPSAGTYHPKLYVARSGTEARALVGSANLTGGLISNVEIGVLLRGSIHEPMLRDAWLTASAIWDDAGTTWQPMAAETTDERFSPDLLAELQRAVAADPVFLTLGQSKPNRVVELSRTGVWVETEATARKGTPAQEVPAWMFELAWEHLRTHAELSNRYLLAKDGLNVKRSSAVCAVLARLPHVDHDRSAAGIVLRWTGPR